MHFTFIGVLMMTKLDSGVFSESVLDLLMALNTGVKKIKFLAQQTELSESPSSLQLFQRLLLPNKIKPVFLKPLKTHLVMSM